ncbi:MAG: HAMP domain-containing protein [Candidatus Altiarchaeota archaeon]|nr:HAMP domain-containing protein [Candidatus Altiarchaeota archaeon]
MDQTIEKDLTTGVQTAALALDFSNVDYYYQLGSEQNPQYWEIIERLDGIAGVFEFSYIYVLYKTGPEEFTFILDTDEELRNGPFEEINEVYEDAPEEILTAWNTGELVITAEPYTDEWGSFKSAFLPIKRGNETLAVLAADYDIQFLSGIKKKALYGFLLAVLLSSGFAAFISIAVSRGIIRPITSLTKFADDLSQGKMKSEFVLHRRDEIGQVAKALCSIRDNYRDTLLNEKNRLSELKDLSDKLKITMERAKSALADIVGRSAGIEQHAEKHTRSVAATSEAADRIIRNIGTLGDLIAKQSKNLSQSSASIEEMVGSINSVAKNTSSVAGSFERLVEASGKGKDKLTQVDTMITQIAEQSESLLEMNKIVSSIASQTNLLAMNAAIEAAHAGEMGRGFAVVADEVRKLAENSAVQSKDIRHILEETKNTIAEVVETSREATSAYNSITEHIQGVNQLISEVESATEEQNEGSRQILEALESIHTITRDVENQSSEMREGNQVVIHEISSLMELSQSIEKDIHDILKRISEVDSSLDEVDQLCERNKEYVAGAMQSFDL